jgi:hypothetical protein
MTFLEELTAHKGGLVCLKTELFWYGGRGWDGSRGRVCLLMDSGVVGIDLASFAQLAAVAVAADADDLDAEAAAALLLLDGHPRWVWVAQEDVELL